MKENKRLTLSVLPKSLGICHLAKNTAVPDWTLADDFSCVAKTASELSVICPQEKIPAGVLAEKDWRAFKVEGPLGFTLTGIVASLAEPLAKEKISIFYISTYETDYLLVEDKNLAKAEKILGKFCDIKK